MVVYANEGTQEYKFKIGDKIILNKAKLSIGYANINNLSQKLQS
jgi:hypothetical protein